MNVSRVRNTISLFLVGATLAWTATTLFVIVLLVMSGYTQPGFVSGMALSLIMLLRLRFLGYYPTWKTFWIAQAGALSAGALMFGFLYLLSITTHLLRLNQNF